MHEPRYLAARSEMGYTTRLQEALPAEPEAVDADEQARLTAQARLQTAVARRRVWLDSRRRLEAEHEQLRQAYGREIADELRGLRRTIERLDQKLAA